jgi:membrane-associated phospholipid phosphatase
LIQDASPSPPPPTCPLPHGRTIAIAVCLAWLVAIPLTVAYDPPLRQAYHHAMDGFVGLTQAAQVISDLVSPEFIAPVVLLLVILDRRLRYWFLADIAGASLGQGVVEHVLKHAFGRLRPEAAGGLSVFTGPHWDGRFGFPSGHALAAFALAGVLSVWYPRWRWVFIIGAIIVCLARVQLDRHFFGDVVFGSFAGWYLAIGIVTWRRRLIARRRARCADKKAAAELGEEGARP